MISSKSIRAGILVAIAAAGSFSCGGETEFTQPNPQSDIVAVQTSEIFLNSPQQETRELLIDGRVTDIEWNLTGNPSIVLMEGVSGGGGNYYVSVRSMWTVDRFGAPDGILFLLQWPDLTEDRLEEPLVTSADVVSDQGDTLDCAVDDALIREENWTRSGLQEDEVKIEFFSDELGSYPKDVWRWGASTTDFSSPVSATEFTGALGVDDAGSTEHPSASTMEDFFDMGGGALRDSGLTTYIPNHTPGSNVPRRIVDKGTRDSRFNRGKPVPFVVWESVSKPFTKCELLNPIRIDEASERDKTWNPEDYVPSHRSRLAKDSQADVLAKSGWIAGKWALEVRRDLIPRPPDLLGGVPAPPWDDDVQIEPGRRYLMRISVTDGTTKATSRSPLVPVYLKPNSP
jgi:hypothetical protein